jgi:small subunit ribosomal protein S2
MLHRALQAVRDVASGGGRVLFVGTKRQAQDIVAEHAKACGMYYVNHRWLGGMLTNWRTVSQSIKRLRELEDQLTQDNAGMTKKELLNLTREQEKLERTLGGIKEMAGLPDLIFIIDTNKEHLAIDEARVLNIPVVAVLDSNSSPEGVQFPIPGNDDAIRAISLYCELVSGSILDGLEAEMAASGIDIGESEEVPVEAALTGEEAEVDTSADVAAADALVAADVAAADTLAAETDAVTAEVAAEETPSA